MLLTASLGLLVGIPLGLVIHRGGFCMHSAFRQILRGERSSWQVPEAPEFLRRFLGGLLMGFGGTLAGGCNIGNALTGLSILSLNSLVATASILLGLALAVRVQGLHR